MKRFFFALTAWIGFSVAFVSCQKAPFLSMTGPRSYSFTQDGGTQTFAFACNRDWSISSSDSWVRISPSSGKAADGDILVTLTVNPNTTYDSRTATLILMAEGLSETISVTQDMGLGLVVSPTTFDLTNEAQTIEIEVQKNVSYLVTIDDACKEWIKQGGTRALSTDKISFSISANNTYDNREGRITVKQTDGNLSETVVVRQKQTDGLFITTPEYNLSNENHTLSVEVKANVSFDVTSEVEWIHYVESRSLSSSTITLSVDANETYDARTGKISVKQSDGPLTGVITVNQAEKYGLFVSPEESSVTKDAQIINVEVKYNVEYEVIIPDASKNWVSIQTEPGTRALTTESISFSITENTSYISRETAIAFKQKNGDLTGTVKITQDQTDFLGISPQNDSLSYLGGSTELRVSTNMDYVLSTNQADDWFTIGEKVEEGEKDGLTTFVYTISAPENEIIVSRSATIEIKDTNGVVLESFTLTQDPQPIVIFEDERFKEYCVSNFDKNGDGEVSYKEAAIVDYIWCPTLGIKSLKGIECFTSLVTLSCELNKLSDLDLSGNPLLRELYCSRNFITSFDLSSNPQIETFYCVGNGATSIVLKGCSALSHLECQENEMESIDLSECTSLKTLYVSSKNLTQLDLSKNTILQTFSCVYSDIRVLDLSNNLDLLFADCINNPHLSEIVLKVGQRINFLRYPDFTAITYVE